MGGSGELILLSRRGGGGVERGGDACIALGGAFLAFHPCLVLELRMPIRAVAFSGIAGLETGGAGK